MRHCLRVRSRWPDLGQTFSCAFMDLESRHSQAGTTDPLFTPVANQNPTVNLPCPIDAFQRRPGHVKGCPSLPKLQINQKFIVNHASGNHTRMVMQSVLHPHHINFLHRFSMANHIVYGKYVLRVRLQRSICCRIPAQFLNMVALYIPFSRIRIKQHPWIMSPGCLFFLLDKIEKIHLHCRSFGTIILF